ncbi:hypothetical protein [Mycobacterium sp. NPDC050853]|uniref:hypothetical protein n=1 Tax=Mycobacterium sp. NPDC050853 TaxID=3155160 RepID=UPI0033EA967B
MAPNDPANRTPRQVAEDTTGLSRPFSSTTGTSPQMLNWYRQRAANGFGMAEELKVNLDRLRADAPYWDKESSWWAGISRTAGSIALSSTCALVNPFTSKHNAGKNDMSNFISKAPSQLTATANKILGAANDYDQVDSNANGLEAISVKDGLPEHTRFSPSLPVPGVADSTGVESAFAKSEEAIGAIVIPGPGDAFELQKSLEVLQGKAGTQLDVNPFDGGVGIGSQLAVMAVAAKMTGSLSGDGVGLLGELEAKVGAMASGSAKISLKELGAEYEAFFGAKATAEGKLNLGPLALSGKLGALLGGGAGGGGKFGIKEDVLYVKVDAELAAALGLSAEGVIGINLKTLLDPAGNDGQRKTWTTTSDQIESEGKKLDGLEGKVIAAALKMASSKKVQKQSGLSGAYFFAGGSLANAISEFDSVYQMVRDAKDYQKDSDNAGNGWATVISNASSSMKNMDNVNCAGYWTGSAASMYQNLADRHALSAYEVAIAADSISSRITDFAETVNTLFGVAIAAAASVSSEAAQVIETCNTYSDDDTVLDVRAPLEGIKNAIEKTAKVKAALIVATTACIEKGAGYGSQIVKVAGALGAGTWAAA